MGIFDSDVAAWEYLNKGYCIVRITQDQSVKGVNDQGEEHEVFIPKGAVAVVTRLHDGTPRWFLPQLTPPDQPVIGTGLTFAEVYEREGLDTLELLLPYTGQPEEEQESA